MRTTSLRVCASAWLSWRPSCVPLRGSWLELTGDAPRIVFGVEGEDGACELKLDRANGQLTSSCEVGPARRRLGPQEVAGVGAAEHAALKAEHRALKAAHEALKAEFSEATGELRSAIDALTKK